MEVVLAAASLTIIPCLCCINYEKKKVMLGPLLLRPSCVVRAGPHPGRLLPGLLPQSENVCSVCGHEGVDELHQFWECPGLASSDWPEASGSQALVPMAINEASTFPCLWFRGMLPASLCCSAPIPPPTELLDIHLFDPHGLSPNPLVWPPGLYGTDGAGGEFSSFPELRRVGCGIARMSELDGGGGFELIWAANLLLPGVVQTVPRSELFAIVVLLGI